MHIKNKRGQSTVEYILLFTAVIVVVIAFLGPKNSVFSTQLNSVFNQAAADINSESGYLSAGHTATSAPTNPDAGIPSGYTVNVL